MTGRHAGTRLGALLSAAIVLFFSASSGLAMTGLSGGSDLIPYEEPAAFATPGTAETLAAAGVPQVLEQEDVALYRRVFALQEEGLWDEADTLIAQLSDRRLMGHVLHQRYMHPTDYRSTFTELSAWLSDYADHPGATTIHALALQRKPDKAPAPRQPEARGEFRVDFAAVTAAPEDKGVSDLLHNIAAAPGDFTTAGFGDLPGFTLGRGTAGSWSMPGDREQARKIAGLAAELAASAAPEVNWREGLAAWKEGEIAQAAAHFQAIVLNGETSAWRRSASAYWAGRAALRLGQPQEMSHWLREALKSPRSFYGLLAHQALGAPPQFSFEALAYDEAASQRLMAQPAIKRIGALIQAGQGERAAEEIESLDGTFDFSEAEALLALIDGAGLAAKAFDLASRMAQVVEIDGGLGTLDVGLFPLPPWEPAEGFKIDRALLYALMRQESAFNPAARSAMGASGLMQIMPTTASYIIGDKSLNGANRHLLLDPAYNLEIAQRYVSYLLDNEEVQGSLLHMAVAYNAGPGNLQRWLEKMRSDGHDLEDPLLFIESIPSQETRQFVSSVLTNFWMYRMRLGQAAASLETLAAGGWPRYEAVE